MNHTYALASAIDSTTDEFELDEPFVHPPGALVVVDAEPMLVLSANYKTIRVVRSYTPLEKMNPEWNAAPHDFGSTMKVMVIPQQETRKS